MLVPHRSWRFPLCWSVSFVAFVVLDGCSRTEALEVKLLNCMSADVGLPTVSEPLMGVKEVRNMVQLVLCILDEPYSK